MHSSALALFWKTVCLEDVDVYLAPARSSFSSCSTQFIPVLGLHLSTSSQLVSFIALYFFHFIVCVFFLMPILHISNFFFSIDSVPFSFSSSFHYKTDHIFPFNVILKHASSPLHSPC